MKDKSKVLKTYRDVCDKLHLVFLIGGGFVTRGSSRF